MAQDTDQPAAAAVGEHPADDDGHDDGRPERADLRLTRRVHVILGIVVAALGAWLLYLSHTELAFRGENHEPGPGYLPVLLTIGLIALGLALAAAWIFGPRARSGDAPALSLEPRGMARAGLVWLALVVCAFLIEPLGFLVAGEVLVVLVIVVIERMRSIPSIVALLLVPPAMYLLFATLLEVQLPEGTLWR
jgi:Tripartite tricarboxylate transporter TctB family